MVKLPLRTGWWRGLGLLPNIFAIESFIDGMAKVKGNFVILLDLGKVLSVDEISVLNGMASSQEPLHTNA